MKSREILNHNEKFVTYLFFYRIISQKNTNMLLTIGSQRSKENYYNCNKIKNELSYDFLSDMRDMLFCHFLK